MEWPHGEKAATDFTATTLPANMSRRQLVRRVKQRWRTTGVRDAKGELGLDHYRGRSFRGEPHVSWCCLLRVLSSPSAPGLFPPRRKNCHAEASHRHDGADGNPPGAALPGFLHHCAPGRLARPATWLPDAPVSQTAIDGTAVAMPVNTDGRSLFESVVLACRAQLLREHRGLPYCVQHCGDNGRVKHQILQRITFRSGQGVDTGCAGRGLMAIQSIIPKR